MKTSRIICAAMAAVMTVGMAGGRIVSADGPARVSGDSAVVTTSDGEYKEGDQSFKDGEKYKEYIEEGYKVRDDGLVYLSEDSKVYVYDYIGNGEELVIPAEIDGVPVKVIWGTHGDCDEKGLCDLPTLKKLVIEAPVERMSSVFVDCKKLETVVLPEGLKEFNDYEMCYAFKGCTSLKEVTIPSTLEMLEGACFRDTPWLEDKEEKEKLVVIGKCLLSGRKAEGKVVIPEGVEWISSEAFYDNTKMTELVIPASVSYSSFAFKNCTGLKKVTFKNGSTGFNECFKKEYAPNLEKVIIPPTFTKSGAKVLLGFDLSDEEKLSENTTYYYYKGTPAEKVLKSKRCYGLKKSVLPGKTKSITVAGKSKAVSVKWKSVSTATGYQIQVSPDKAFKKNTVSKYVKDSKKTSYTFKKLKSGKKYYVRMRTYKTISGKKYYGNYTKARTVTVK